MLTKTKLIKLLQTCRIFKAEFLRASDVDPKFLSDPEVMLLAMKRDSDSIREASDSLRNQRQFIVEAMKLCGPSLAIALASEELQADKELLLAAVKSNGYSLRYASEELKGDREVVMEAVKQNGMVLEYASYELRADKDVVLAAVRQNGLALKFSTKFSASYEVRGDEDVVLEAVKQDGMALKYASQELKEKRNIAFEAMKNDLAACRLFGGALVYDILQSLDSDDGFSDPVDMPPVWEHVLNEHGWMRGWVR